MSTTAANVFALSTAGVSFTLSVLNSGTAVVHGEVTEIRFDSASVPASCLDVRSTIPLTVPGTTYPSTLVINATSTCDSFYNSPIRMIAEAEPLHGETDTANNRKTYLVEFTKG
jgi:spore coat protein U-like protein